MVQLVALASHEILTGILFLECSQQNVVRQITGILHRLDGIDRQCIFPNRILTGSRNERRNDNGIRESHHLTLGIEHVILIAVLQGINAVLARCNPTNGESSATVSARYTVEWFSHKSAVAQVLVKPYLNALDRFQIRSLQHCARNLHGIDSCTGRERIGEITHRIPFVVVYNGIRKVDGISSRILQCIYQFHDHFLSHHLEFWLVQLRRRNNHLFRCLLQLDELIELQLYLLVLDIHRMHSRIAS